MNKNVALCVAVVIMCIVTPIGVGYLYPSDSYDVTEYNVAKTTDISSSLQNAEIPAYGYFSGNLNNMFQMNGDDLVAEPVKTTSTIGAWPYITESERKSYDITELGGSGAKLSYADFAAHADPDAYMTTFIVEASYGYWEGKTYHVVIYSHVTIYPATNQMYLWRASEPLNQGTVVFTDVKNATNIEVSLGPFSSSDTTVYQVTYKQATSTDGTPLYVDSSGGVLISEGTDAYWSNTMDNSRVTFVVPTKDSTTIGYVTGTSGNAGYSPLHYLKVVVESGNVYVQNGNSTYTQKELIGSSSVYDHLLFEYVYDENQTATITVTGLTGMTSIAGDYSDKKGSSATFKLLALTDPLKAILFNCTEPSAYYVHSAYVRSGTTKVMEDASVAPAEYYPDGNWSLRLSSTAIYGDSITVLTKNGGYGTWVEDGKISLCGLENIPLRGMTIENYTDADGNPVTKINGIALAEEYAGWTGIQFGGTWNMAVYLSDLDATTHKGYTWVPGGFGLDVQGFALVGIASAALSAIAVGLWGKESGQKVILALVTASMCGVVYFLML